VQRDHGNAPPCFATGGWQGKGAETAYETEYKAFVPGDDTYNCWISLELRPLH
jgi:hypothetical protein